MIRYILLDIEGTTTDVDFVHKILFPYSEKHMGQFVSAHAADPDVQACLRSVQETLAEESGQSISDQAAVTHLIEWIRRDRKHTALKQLQGMIWKAGYENGDYKSHVYDDVPECLDRWTGEGLKIGIYSSGSIQAQQLLFAHSIHGDLTVHFSHYFDTTTGGKKEAASYQKIAQSLNLAPTEILFLSDIEEELDAATQTGLQVIQLVRGSTKASTTHPTATSFTEIRLPSAVSG